MKNITIFLIVLYLIPLHAFSQTYTEIFEGEWGQGRDDTRPCIADFNNDGLLDLIVGLDDGTLHHLIQDAAISDSFSLVSKSFSNILVDGRASPEIVDIDNDGLLDLLIGTRAGYIHHLEQDSIGSNNFSLITNNFNEIIVEGYACPRFINLDNNGLLDMILGKKNGTLSHYEQNALGSEEFTLITDLFNNIDVGHLSTPSLIDLDHDGLLDMLIGESVGFLHHYEQTSVNSTLFDSVTDSFNGIDVGAQACPIFTDLNNDLLFDLFIGGGHGHLDYFRQIGVGSDSVKLISANVLPGIDIGTSSVPSFTDLNGNGLLDMIVGNNDGRLSYFEQSVEGSSVFTLIDDTVSGIDVGSFSAPAFADIDKDNLMDMIVGEYKNNLNHYEQDTIGSLSFALVTTHFDSIELGEECHPAFTDLDDDGLLDMIIGVAEGTMGHYEQNGEGSTGFTLVSDHFNDIDLDWVAHPSFTDLDSDGLLDMIVGESNGAIYHYEQDTAGSLIFNLITDHFMSIDEGSYSKPTFADINMDGMEDLVIGYNNGGLYYFQRDRDTRIEQKGKEPFSGELIQNYPNPFHLSTTIQYAIPRFAKVNITIFNMLGETVKVLENSYHQAGSFTIQWDGTDKNNNRVMSGLYFCNVHIGNQHQSFKLLLIK